MQLDVNSWISIWSRYRVISRRARDYLEIEPEVALRIPSSHFIPKTRGFSINAIATQFIDPISIIPSLASVSWPLSVWRPGMETGGAPSQGMADRHPLTVRGDNDAATTREEAPEGGRSEPPYIPQFSAATSLILDRIKAKSGFNSALSDASASLTTPDRDAFEDARSRLVQSMRSSGSSDGNKPTIHPTADKTATAETEPTTRENGATAAGSKRKREDEPETESAEPEQHPRPEPEPVDFMQNTIVMPPPLPRRHPQKKKPATPVHDPRRQQQIEEARERRLAQYLPAEPAKPELVGFASGVASDEAVSLTCRKGRRRIELT